MMVPRLFAVLGLAGGLWGAVPVEAGPAEPGSSSGGDAGAAQATGELVGRVAAADGTPAGRVLISLSGPGGTSLVVSDAAGRFGFRALAPGRYLLRTHLTSVSGRRVFEIGPVATVYQSLVLAGGPAPAAIMLAGSGIGHDAPATLVTSTRAGEGEGDGRLRYATQPAATPDSQPDEEPEALTPHDHGVKAWRLRRARRSVLKDRDAGAGTTDPSRVEEPLDLGQPVRWAMTPDGTGDGHPITDLIGGTPVVGEVQLLTRATLSGPGQLWSTSALPGQVAYVSLVQAGERDWAVRGAVDMTAGETSSWALAGWYSADPHEDHSLELAVSYSKQAIAGLGEARLDPTARSVDDGMPSREVGRIEALDMWTVSPRLTVGYGTALARYGYLQDGTLFSPRASVTFVPVGRAHVRVAASQLMTAPGAEQFLPPLDGVWLPPERTFTTLSRFDHLQAERARHLEVAVGHDLGAASTVEVRRFRQEVGDQLITMFGSGGHVPPGTLPAPGGHYHLARADGVDTDGWGVTFTHAPSGRFRGEVDYSMVHAEWSPWTASGLSPRTVGVFRTGFERFHDVTTTVETEFPETATRVFARCRVNTAFARSHRDAVTSGVDARFDVRVTQALPFSPFEGSSWEVLVAIRSLFHEQADGASVYDELLVVDPPRQFVGGLVVHF